MPRISGRRPVAAACVVGIALFVLLYDLGSHRTLASHEVLIAVPAREMLATGDWIIPRFGGVPRLEKPPLGYWLTAASSRVVGETSAVAARLPAALAALALAALLAWWATRWYGRRAGTAAGLLSVTSVATIIYGRKAEIDMVLCLLTTLALCLIAFQPDDESNGRRFVRWTGIYGLLGLSFLAKFHYGPAMVLAPYLAYHLGRRRYRPLLDLLNPAGLAVFGACALIWPQAVLQQLPGAAEVWRLETIGRAVGAVDPEPVWFYVPVLLFLSLPWTTLVLRQLPVSFQAAWRDGDHRERFLWVWILTQFGVLVLSVSKHQNYALAMMPAVTLMAARQMVVVCDRIHAGQPVLRRWEAAATTAGLLLTAAAAGLFVSARWPVAIAPTLVVCGLVGIAGITAPWLLASGWTRGGVAVAAAAFVAVYAIVNDAILPRVDHRAAAARFGREVRRVAGDRPVTAFELGTTPIVFYIGDAVRRVRGLDDMAASLTTPPTLVVTSTRNVERLTTVGDVATVLNMGVPADTPEPLVLLTVSGFEAAPDRAR